jgi:hypothetical protein
LNSSADIKVAEGAFVSAVVRTFEIQSQMLELREKLQQADADAERANDKALREAGISETSPPDKVIDTQERFLELAIKRAGIEGTPLAAAARDQIRQMRQALNDAMMQEANRIGQFGGPVL